ncbi:FadR family transcriptional regulator [Actinomadura barringtoniae]|uniref:FadR family transcriptional regulator n=1 Tax=Actinomadura barringtoniae TaxID=1427535 RepID=A0A939PG16_9ACTN|nr:FadR/GntR family transcriptional regulator [Actinomadura barringtoniae]MBO2451850.1 FadR family transcriptional regulator [Actinomadura barringtoniae]
MTEDNAIRTTVTDRAIEQIKAKLASGELVPGQRLPTERDLAAELGLSRSSMREAIRALTVLGVLEARHGAGVYVTQLEPSDLLETFGAVAEISRGETLLHLVQVRKILEPAAAATAAARITDEGLALLRAEMRAMERGTTSEEIVGHDLEFHRIITGAAGNPVLAAILGGLNSRTFRARVWRGYQEDDVFTRTFDEHEEIYRALVDRDPEGARIAAAIHIGAVEHWARHQAAQPADPQAPDAPARTGAPGQEED